MAPPINRRTGYSRRAQYTTFFGYVAAVIGALVGFGLLLIAFANPGAFARWRGVVADVSSPPANLVAKGRADSIGFFDSLSGYALAGHENARLRREVAETRVSLAEMQAVADENRRLKEALHIAVENPRPITTARMISSTSTSTRRFATISAGSDLGVTSGMAVRSPLGLVGRIVETGRKTARVLLITDGNSIVPVRRASDGVPAFATGNANGTLQLRLLNLGINPLHKGDAFVTSGSGGLYRPGIAIAVVSELTRDGAVGHVLSDPAASEYVVVDPEWEPVLDPSLPPPQDATLGKKRRGKR